MMKSIRIFCLLLFLGYSSSLIHAQPNSNKIEETELKEKICTEVSKVKLGSGETCDLKAQELVNRMKNAMTLSYAGDVLTSEFAKIGDLIKRMNDKAKKKKTIPPLEKGPFKTLEDRIFYAYSGSKKYADFVRTLTGGTVNELKDGKGTRELYEYLKKLEKSMKKKQMKVAVSRFSSPCPTKLTFLFSTPKLTYPVMQWAGIVKITADCTCKSTDNTEVDKLELAVYFTVTSTLESRKVQSPFTAKGPTMVTRVIPVFENPKNIKLRFYQVDCCGANRKGAFEDPSTDENISMPDTSESTFIGVYLDDILNTDTSDHEADRAFNQYVNTGLGIGYDNSTKELQFCVGTGYFRQIVDGEKSDLFAGAEVKYELATVANDGNNFTRSTVQFGPALEARFPISGDKLALTAGAAGGVGFGSQGFSDQKDNLSMGYLEGRVGMYVQFPSWAIGAQVPIFSYQRTTVKNEVNSFSSNTWSFALNKANPLEIRVIIPLGNKN